MNYLAVWHFCSILCCSNLSDLQSDRKCYNLKIIGFKAFFSPTCARKGLSTLIKYKAIKWREQLVGSARKELTFKLIFESINLKLMKRTRCVWSWIKERWMRRRFFFNVLSRPSWRLIFKIWPLPHTQKYLKIIVTQSLILTLPCAVSVK